MATINNFEDLITWREARKLSELIYNLCCKSDFNRHDHIRIQMERASGSVMDNIAEGFERRSNKEFIQYLYIAKGSCGEVRSQLYRSFDYKIITLDDLNYHLPICKKLGTKIFAFINYLKQSSYKGDKFNSVSEPLEIYGKQSNSEASNLSNSKASNSLNNEESNSEASNL